MKTKRLNFVMPLVAMMLAMGGAFAFNVAFTESEAFTPEPGYLDASLPCTQVITCDTQGTFICKNPQGIVAYGKDGLNCERLLFMPPQ